MKMKGLVKQRRSRGRAETGQVSYSVGSVDTGNKMKRVKPITIRKVKRKTNYRSNIQSEWEVISSDADHKRKVGKGHASEKKNMKETFCNKALIGEMDTWVLSASGLFKRVTLCRDNNMRVPIRNLLLSAGHGTDCHVLESACDEGAYLQRKKVKKKKRASQSVKIGQASGRVEVISSREQYESRNENTIIKSECVASADTDDNEVGIGSEPERRILKEISNNRSLIGETDMSIESMNGTLQMLSSLGDENTRVPVDSVALSSAGHGTGCCDEDERQKVLNYLRSFRIQKSKVQKGRSANDLQSGSFESVDSHNKTKRVKVISSRKKNRISNDKVKIKSERVERGSETDDNDEFGTGSERERMIWRQTSSSGTLIGEEDISIVSVNGTLELASSCSGDNMGVPENGVALSSTDHGTGCRDSESFCDEAQGSCLLWKTVKTERSENNSQYVQTGQVSDSLVSADRDNTMKIISSRKQFGSRNDKTKIKSECLETGSDTDDDNEVGAFSETETVILRSLIQDEGMSIDSVGGSLKCITSRIDENTTVLGNNSRPELSACSDSCGMSHVVLLERLDTSSRDDSSMDVNCYGSMNRDFGGTGCEAEKMILGETSSNRSLIGQTDMSIDSMNGTLKCITSCIDENTTVLANSSSPELSACSVSCSRSPVVLLERLDASSGDGSSTDVNCHGSMNRDFGGTGSEPEKMILGETSSNRSLIGETDISIDSINGTLKCVTSHTDENTTVFASNSSPELPACSVSCIRSPVVLLERLDASSGDGSSTDVNCHGSMNGDFGGTGSEPEKMILEETSSNRSLIGETDISIDSINGTLKCVTSHTDENMTVFASNSSPELPACSVSCSRSPVVLLERLDASSGDGSSTDVNCHGSMSRDFGGTGSEPEKMILEETSSNRSLIGETDISIDSINGTLKCVTSHTDENTTVFASNSSPELPACSVSCSRSPVVLLERLDASSGDGSSTDVNCHGSMSRDFGGTGSEPEKMILEETSSNRSLIGETDISIDSINGTLKCVTSHTDENTTVFASNSSPELPACSVSCSRSPVVLLERLDASSGDGSSTDVNCHGSMSRDFGGTGSEPEKMILEETSSNRSLIGETDISIDSINGTLKCVTSHTDENTTVFARNSSPELPACSVSCSRSPVVLLERLDASSGDGSSTDVNCHGSMNRDFGGTGSEPVNRISKDNSINRPLIGQEVTSTVSGNGSLELVTSCSAENMRVLVDSVALSSAGHGTDCRDPDSADNDELGVGSEPEEMILGETSSNRSLIGEEDTSIDSIGDSLKCIISRIDENMRVLGNHPSPDVSACSLSCCMSPVVLLERLNASSGDGSSMDVNCHGSMSRDFGGTGSEPVKRILKENSINRPSIGEEVTSIDSVNGTLELVTSCSAENMRVLVDSVALSSAGHGTDCRDPKSVCNEDEGVCLQRKKVKWKRIVEDDSLSDNKLERVKLISSRKEDYKNGGMKIQQCGVVSSDTKYSHDLGKRSESNNRALGERVGTLIDSTSGASKRVTLRSDGSMRVLRNCSIPELSASGSCSLSPVVILKRLDESLRDGSSKKVNVSINRNFGADVQDPFSNTLSESSDCDSSEDELPEEDKEKMKNLQVMSLHTVHPSHTIERAVSRVPTPAEKEALARFNIRTSNFTMEENRILCENIKAFLKDHGFKDASPFVTAGAHLRAGARREVMQYLGQGLPHRSLHQINQRFMAVIRNENKKPFTKKEDKIIDTVLKSGCKNPYAELSKRLNRSRLSVYKRVKMLKENKEGLGGSKIRQFDAKDLAQKILQMLTAEKKCRPEALKNRRIKMKVWRKVAEKLNMRPRQLYDYWKHQLHCSLFAEGPVSKGETLMKIVEWLHDIQPKNDDEIPWANSTHLVPGATSWFMFAAFRDLRGTFKADSFKSFPDFLNTLYRLRSKALVPYNGMYLKRYRIHRDKSLTVIQEEECKAPNKRELPKVLELFFKKAKDLDVLK